MAHLARSAGIDLLRGLSVLAVVLHHIHLRFVLGKFDVQALLPKPLGRVCFWSGYYAVIAFFVISGFLITSLSLRRWGSLAEIDVKAFYWMRAARILPCLLLLLSVLSALHLAGVPEYVIPRERASLARAALAALTFHFNWLEGTRGYLPGAWDVLWSLSIEEAFYLAFPLVCVALRRQALLLIPIGALIVAGPISRVYTAEQAPWDEYAYLSCMDGIAFGCLAALIHVRLAPRRSWLYVALGTGMAMVLLIDVLRPLTNELGLVSTGLYVSVLELGVALLLLACAGGLGETWLARCSGWIGAVGRISYEVYLTHMFVLLALMRAFKAFDGSLRWIWLWYGAGLALSLTLGFAVSKLYSEPSNRALRREPKTVVSAAPKSG